MTTSYDSKLVRVEVYGGVVHIASIPPGVMIEVLDYDVDPEDVPLAEFDRDGDPYVKYILRSGESS